MAKAKKKTARRGAASKAKTAAKGKNKPAKKSKLAVKPKSAMKPKSAAKAKAKPKPRPQAPKKVGPIPEGLNSVQAQLVQENCAAALDYYKRAFGAKELMRMPGPDGKIMHAEIRIGDSVVFMSDQNESFPDYKAPLSLGAVTGSIYMFVDDVDRVHRKAIEEGGAEAMAPSDMFWGDRMSLVIDPWGHRWTLATHVRDVTPAEMQAAMAAQAPPPQDQIVQITEETYEESWVVQDSPAESAEQADEF